ncbi:MAG: deoxyribose-phosphate aldolase [Methanobrevibacter sp.]
MIAKTPEELARCMDFTYLDNTATKEDMDVFCKIAADWNMYSVVVSPCYVKQASQLLKDTDVKVGTVVGFPLGTNDKRVKALEAKIAVEDGADEIDMVMNIPAFVNGNYDIITDEIAAVKSEIGDKILKVIIETNLLNEKQIKKISEIVNETDADFIKTNTGFTGKNTFNEMVTYLQIIKTAANNKEIKASGGIRNRKTCARYLAAGASRLGCSTANIILEEFKNTLENKAYKPRNILGNM